MYNKKVIWIIILMTGLIHLGYSCYNPNGHDYNEYSFRLENNEVNDLPISWTLMKLFTLIFGNPLGLYILSYISCIGLYCIFAYKINNINRLIIFTMFFYFIYPIWYISSGLIRNLIGLCFMSYFILYKDNSDSFYDSFIIGFTHVPTLIIFLGYNISKRYYKKVIYSVVSLLSILIIGLFIRGNFLESAIKPFNMLYYKLVSNPFYFKPFIYKGVNVLTYSAIVIGFLFMTLIISKFNLETLYWSFLLLMPFIPIYSYKVQFRFLLFSIISFLMTFIKCNEECRFYYDSYFILSTFLSIFVRIML